jgi:hypothetical protein
VHNHQTSTSSLSLAAAIYALHPSSFIEVDRPIDSPKASFVFDSKLFDTELINKFWAGQLPVDASRYFEALKRLKSLLYEAR